MSAKDDGQATGLRVETRDGVSTWTLDRPQRKNAIDLRLARALQQACDAAAEDRSVRVVVVRGTEGNFCSGGDLTGGENGGGQPGGSIAANTLGMLRAFYGNMVLSLHRLPKPTIAVVEGVAAGAGMNLALACDLVYAASDARFCQIFVRRGLSIDCGGTWLLPRIVGLQRAKQLAFFGEWMSAGEAEGAGIVTAVCEPAELAAFAAERAATLAARPPVPLSLMKHALDRSFQTGMAEALEQEANAQAVCVATEDFGEAMRAFAEKREPRFGGG